MLPKTALVYQSHASIIMQLLRHNSCLPFHNVCCHNLKASLSACAVTFYRHMTPIAGFSDDFMDAHGLKDENVSPVDADSKDADQHGPDGAASKHAGQTNSLTGRSIWGLFGKDNGKDKVTPSSREASASSVAAEAHEPDGAQTRHNLQDAQEVHDVAHSDRSSSGAVARGGTPNGDVHQDDGAGQSALDNVNEDRNNMGIDSKNGGDGSDSSQRGHDKDEHDQQAHNHGMYPQQHDEASDEASAFNSSQFWRTPLVVSDDIEAA